MLTRIGHPQKVTVRIRADDRTLAAIPQTYACVLKHDILISEDER
jgi:hypothetical protein